MALTPEVNETACLVLQQLEENWKRTGQKYRMTDFANFIRQYHNLTTLEVASLWQKYKGGEYTLPSHSFWTGERL